MPLPLPLTPLPALPRLPALLATRRRCLLLAVAGLPLGLLGCALAPTPKTALSVSLPLSPGWFDGQPVFYITTEVSDAAVAREKGAIFTPRLADALPVAGSGQRNPTDRVYAVMNFDQAPVFASAPLPVGPDNRDEAYTPLWQMVMVSWRAGATPRALRSQEEVLAASEARQLDLTLTRVVLNCAIVHRGERGSLPGAVVRGPLG